MDFFNCNISVSHEKESYLVGGQMSSLCTTHVKREEKRGNSPKSYLFLSLFLFCRWRRRKRVSILPPHLQPSSPHQPFFIRDENFLSAHAAALPLFLFSSPVSPRFSFFFLSFPKFLFSIPNTESSSRARARFQVRFNLSLLFCLHSQ